MAEGPLFDAESVLETAFGHHDFIGQHKGREVHIQTTEPIVEDGAVYVEVTAQTDSLEHYVVYRYRVEFDMVIEADDPRATVPPSQA